MYAEGARELLFTENDSNATLLWGAPNESPYVKDAFHDVVVSGQRDRVNPAMVGTKAAARWTLRLPPGASAVMRMRWVKGGSTAPFGDFDEVFRRRLQEADDFYRCIAPDKLPEDERRV